jgi:hypothetical protein
MVRLFGATAISAVLLKIMNEQLKEFLAIFQDSLAAIKEPLLFDKELGFQGDLLAEIRARLKYLALPGDPIIQQEYQKTLPIHGITIRPDLIVHIPFEREATESRKHGNFVAVEIKIRATQKEAQEDFESLETIKQALNYPLTIFLNVGSLETYARLCPASIATQTVCFAVALKDREAKVVMQPAWEHVTAE